MKKDDYIYLVIVPTGNFYKEAIKIQRYLNKKYRLYGNIMPPLHLTIAAFQPIDTGDTSENYLYELEKYFDGIKRFKISGKGFSAFPSPYRSINIKIISDPLLDKIKEDIHRILWMNNCILGRTVLSSWEYHISLASTTFGRKWSEREWKSAFIHISSIFDFYENFTVFSFQVWFPVYKPKLKILKTYNIKP